MVWVVIGIIILTMACLCILALGVLVFFFGLSPLLFFFQP